MLTATFCLTLNYPATVSVFGTCSFVFILTRFLEQAHLYSFGPSTQLPTLGHKMGGGIGLLTELGASNVPNVPIVVAGINGCGEEYLPA